MCNNYDITYNTSLLDFIAEKEYNLIMDKLMDTLYMLWPCTLCYAFSYMCCICSLGFSCVIPGLRIKRAKTVFLEQIKEINYTHFKSKGLCLGYHEKCSTSWLQIEINEINENNENLQEIKPINTISNNQKE